jgi:phosphopantetheine adenylyltransferase
MDPTDVLQALRASDRPRLVLWPESGPDARSVALLAGSFDPITVAHVAMAEAARAVADLVVLVYAVRTLPKEPGTAEPLFTERERVQVAARVCARREGMALGLCSHGLLAEQVAAAGERFPAASRSVVLGSDKLIQLFDPRWYGDRDTALGALFGAADVRYAVRAGDHVAGALVEAEALGVADRVRPLEVDPGVAAVSARAVRVRARAGGDVGGLVPAEAVAAVRSAVLRERRERRAAEDRAPVSPPEVADPD